MRTCGESEEERKTNERERGRLTQRGIRIKGPETITDQRNFITFAAVNPDSLLQCTRIGTFALNSGHLVSLLRWLKQRRNWEVLRL